MTATSEIAYVCEFQCRHCATPLFGRSSRFTSWMLCPKCCRASLATETRVGPTPRFVPLPDQPADDMLVIGPGPELTKMTPVEVAEFTEIDGVDDEERELGLVAAVSVRRVVASTMLFLSLLMTVVALLNQSEAGVPLFGSIAVLAIAAS